MEKMFSSTTMPASATSLFSAYASLTATMMIVRTMANDLVPPSVMAYIQSFLNYLFTPRPNTVTVKIEDISGMIRNQVYDSADIYLRTKIDPNTERFKASKTKQQNKIQIGIEKGEEIRDRYENIDLKWKFVAVENEAHGQEKRHFELSFSKKHKNKVVEEYLPFVLAKAKEIKDNDRSIKLFTRDCGSFDNEEDGYRGEWGFIYLDHPSNFATLAMEPDAKKAIIDDLDRFLKRKEFYKKVGKAWKRGYLLYGPPGTGKSSLIAAMANYLKFDIYDLELSSMYSDSDLRRVLVSTTNRSIMVIEDIDCTMETRDRELEHEEGYPKSKITLSGLLNFIDGLWSSCGDERIIIFTTNHKERLDPALLRPGRMDMHIHMSYCTFNGFKVLASNYLSVNDHKLYSEIEGLLAKVEVTPATLAEELMKSEDANVALLGVVDLLKQKKRELNNSGSEIEEVTKKNVTKSVRNKRRKGRKANRAYTEDLVV